MESSISIDIAAPPELVFRLARDFERWPSLLPHYVRAAAHARPGNGSIVVDFVALRPLLPIAGLGMPVAWRSRCWAEEDRLRLRFVHVAGPTAGMDVTWQIQPADGGCRVTINHRFSRPLPVPILSELVGSDAFPALVDRFFTRAIAHRTLASFRAIAEAIDGPGRTAASGTYPAR
jgi:ribosome-associated toxin RatA of RatAB toxin-antitoxin module